MSSSYTKIIEYKKYAKKIIIFLDILVKITVLNINNDVNFLLRFKNIIRKNLKLFHNYTVWSV